MDALQPVSFLAICRQFALQNSGLHWAHRSKIVDEIIKKFQIKKKILDEIDKLWMKIEL